MSPRLAPDHSCGGHAESPLTATIAPLGVGIVTVPRIDEGGLLVVSVLVVDNYDSFVFNIVQYLQQLGADVTTMRNDVVSVDDLSDKAGLLISPGPGTPSESGRSAALVSNAIEQQIPVLGVCLGHQLIGEMFGGRVERAPELMHGKTSLVHHSSAGVLAGLPIPFRATRYHSLAIVRDSIPDVLEVTGETDNGIVMAVKHRDYAVEGVQFHPESVLTEGGHRLLANWLETCGDDAAIARSESLTPLVSFADSVPGVTSL